MDILDPPPLPSPPRREIGFHVGIAERKSKTKGKKKA